MHQETQVQRPEGTGLQHGLKRRHLTMIGIGGVIGASLFVGSGGVVSVDEVMYVASGHGQGVKGAEEGELPPGSLIHAAIGVMHQMFNDSPETMKLVCLFNPALPADELSVLLGEEANS